MSVVVPVSAVGGAAIPVVAAVVLLGITVLRERLAAVQIFGLVAAAAAVGLLVAG